MQKSWLTQGSKLVEISESFDEYRSITPIHSITACDSFEEFYSKTDLSEPEQKKGCCCTIS